MLTDDDGTLLTWVSRRESAVDGDTGNSGGAQCSGMAAGHEQISALSTSREYMTAFDLERLSS